VDCSGGQSAGDRTPLIRLGRIVDLESSEGPDELDESESDGCKYPCGGEEGCSITCTGVPDAEFADTKEDAGCRRETGGVLRGIRGSGAPAVLAVREKGCSIDGDILAMVAIIGGRMPNWMTNKRRYLSEN